MRLIFGIILIVLAGAGCGAMATKTASSGKVASCLRAHGAKVTDDGHGVDGVRWKGAYPNSKGLVKGGALDIQVLYMNQRDPTVWHYVKGTVSPKNAAIYKTCLSS